MNVSYVWERVSYILWLNKEIINLTDSEIKKSWFHLYFIYYSSLNKAESSSI